MDTAGRVFEDRWSDVRAKRSNGKEELLDGHDSATLSKEGFNN